MNRHLTNDRFHSLTGPIRLCLVAMILLLLPGTAWADSVANDKLSNRQQRALDQTAPDWYAPDSQSVRNLSDFQTSFTLEEGTKSSARTTATANFSDRLTAIWDSIVDFFDWLRSFLPSSFGTSNFWFWTIIIILAALLIGVLTYIILKMDAVRLALGIRQAEGEKRKRRAATIEDLPFELEGESLTGGNLLQRARRELEAGDLRLAVVFLFSYLLLEMDRKELIRLQKGKTNRAYLSEVRRNGRATLPLYDSVMHAFERSFFGHHPLEKSEVADLVRQTEGWT